MTVAVLACRSFTLAVLAIRTTLGHSIPVLISVEPVSYRELSEQ